MPQKICKGRECGRVRRLDVSLGAARGKAEEYGDMLIRETTFRRIAEEMGLVDPVTRAYNKKGLERRFREEAGKAIRYGRGICLLSVRVDDFGRLGSKHGERACDRVLRSIASTMGSNVRASDTVHRMDEEEFSVLLSETQCIEQGCIVAERIRRRIEAMEVVEETKALPVTASIGVAALGEGMGLQQLIDNAASAGAKASESGQNMVFVFTEGGARPAQELFRQV